jgi:hypothetical protein
MACDVSCKANINLGDTNLMMVVLIKFGIVQLPLNHVLWSVLILFVLRMLMQHTYKQITMPSKLNIVVGNVVMLC